MKRMLALVVALCLCSGIALAGDGVEAKRSTADRFQEARRLAFDGQREEAIALCREILKTNPDARDAKILLGRIQAWNKNYALARTLLEEVLEAHPSDSDARSALIDVELWSGRPAAALELAEEGLELRPGNLNLLTAKARALHKLGLNEEALVAAEQARAGDPDSSEMVDFYRILLQGTQRNKISVQYGGEWFDEGTEPWHTAMISYRREFYWGSITPRLNVAHRFDKNGVQFEVDSYPRIAEHTYGYVNFGVSGDDLFPSIRYGAEVYHNFPKGWEASLGFRRLHFDSGEVTIYTGTIARYIGKYWIQLRPQYVAKGSGDSFSGRARIRRFLNGRYEYIELAGGAGSDLGADIVDNQSDLDSSSVQLSYHRRVLDSLVLKGSIGIGREKLPRRGNRDSIFFRVGFDQFW